MKKPLSIHVSGLLILFLSILTCNITVRAASQNIEIKNGEQKTVDLFIGDTGTIIPQYEPDNPSEKNAESYEYYIENDDNILTVDSNGSFSAIDSGTATVYITGYDEDEKIIYNAQVTFIIQYDMSQVTLAQNSVQGYLFPVYFDKKAYYYDGTRLTVNINSPYIINTDYDYDNFSLSYSSSNPNIYIEAYISDNVLYIYADTNMDGSTILTLNLNGKTFLLDINITKVGISDQSYLLVKKKTKQLTITGYSGPITWASSNPKIATVSADGVVTGKKTGNTVITAKIGDRYLGCVVSVTSSKIKKVVNRATYIGTHWKYSQPKRTQKGYYDCSSLVWKAYKQYGNLTFGSPYYPGVALSEAKWCKAHKRMIKGGLTYKKLQQLKVNPGDLLFKSTNMKKKYQDIYHVEMFTGYYCHSVNADGTPNLSITWAARGSYYSWEEGSLLARPLK